MADNIYFSYDIALKNLSIDEQYQLDRIFRNCKQLNDIIIENINQLITVLEERLSENKKEYAFILKNIEETDTDTTELEEKRQDVIDKMNKIKKDWLEENNIDKGDLYPI